MVPATVDLILRLHEVIGPQTLSTISASGFFAAMTFRATIIRAYETQRSAWSDPRSSQG